ncbi:MAG: hypothetical protein HYX47_20495 [Burkholderiales bacterium]|nr:hypothetical protein [Burkholderiales bacterium]
MNKLWISAALAAACTLALAKIPPPVLDDAGKLKAAETAAKTAWQAKLDGYQLCKAQDKVVASYMKTAKSSGKEVKPATPVVAPAAAAAAASAAQASTPVKAAPLPACADPGPFAFTPPDQKPLEASGAHSPPGNATSPPSTRTPSAETNPAKKS